MNSRLTTTLAVFRIEQDNVGQSTGVPIAGSNGDTAYKAMEGTVSKGVEFEVNGAITDNWQNRVYSDTVTPFGTFRAEQGSYALVDLFTRYQVTKNVSVQGNLNNLFDKTYDTNVDGSIVYGEPRNVSVTASYQF